MSSSTSDSGPTIGSRAFGWLRLTHPFPSVLDGLVSGGVAFLAGGGLGPALTTGVAMTLLQLGIGTANDVVDADRDAGHKPGKPIPAGLVPAGAALGVALACFVAGFGLAWTRSTATGLLALAVAGIGLAYDLRLKGTAWSWLPFAMGIPILPVFGWLAVRPELPGMFVLLIPVAIVAGAALAVGNALVDVERDHAAGVSSIAATLGARRANRVAMVLFGAVSVVASATVIDRLPDALALGTVGAGAVAPLAAILATNAGPAGREWAWRAEALGTAMLAVAWLVAVVPGV